MKTYEYERITKFKEMAGVKLTEIVPYTSPSAIGRWGKIKNKREGLFVLSLSGAGSRASLSIWVSDSNARSAASRSVSFNISREELIDFRDDINRLIGDMNEPR